MEEWGAYYKQYEALILWLLSIPTGIFINRLDDYLKNRSKERKLKAITRYAEVVSHRTMMRSRLPDIKFEMPITMRIMVLTFAIMMVQSFSSDAFTDVLGKNASDLYFWITLVMVLLLNTAATVYGTKEDNIFLDAVHFSEYREKTVAKLAKLEYGSGVLNKIDRETA